MLDQRWASNCTGVAAVAPKTLSAPVNVTVSSGGATFLGTDTTTQGNWRGVYGGDGYNVINDTVSYPPYALVAVRRAERAPRERVANRLRFITSSLGLLLQWNPN